MLAKNGYLDLEEIMDIPGFPGLRDTCREKMRCSRM